MKQTNRSAIRLIDRHTTIHQTSGPSKQAIFRNSRGKEIGRAILKGRIYLGVINRRIFWAHSSSDLLSAAQWQCRQVATATVTECRLRTVHAPRLRSSLKPATIEP